MLKYRDKDACVDLYIYVCTLKTADMDDVTKDKYGKILFLIHKKCKNMASHQLILIPD
jgi:hypothetical protein